MCTCAYSHVAFPDGLNAGYRAKESNLYLLAIESDLDMYGMPFPIITIKFFYIIQFPETCLFFEFIKSLCFHSSVKHITFYSYRATFFFYFNDFLVIWIECWRVVNSHTF